MTVPSADETWDRHRRLLCALCPSGVSLLLLASWGRGCGDGFIFAAGLICSSLGVAIYAAAGNGPSLPRFYPVMTLFAMVSAVLWLLVLSNEITALVEGFGHLFHQSSQRIGFSIVSWGNALGDFAVCLTLASMGQTSFALNAIVSGPIFNTLVGFSSALVMAALRQGGEVVIYEAGWPPDMLWTLHISVGCTVFAVGLIALMALGDEKHVSHGWAWCLFAAYSMFFTLMWKATETPV